MHTSGYANRSKTSASAINKLNQSESNTLATGLISEVVYHEDQP